MKKILFSTIIALSMMFSAAFAYPDVESTHWAYDFIHSLKQIGIFEDVFEDTLGSSTYASKEDFASVIANCYKYLINTK